MILLTDELLDNLAVGSWIMRPDDVLIHIKEVHTTNVPMKYIYHEYWNLRNDLRYPMHEDNCQDALDFFRNNSYYLLTDEEAVEYLLRV